MQKAITLVVFTALLLAVTPAFAESFTCTFTGDDNWDGELYDYAIDVDSVPGSARLLKTELIADETGNMTDATYEVITSDIRARKDFMITDPAVDSAVLLVYVNTPKELQLVVEVNGTPKTVTTDPKRSLTGGWVRVDVDPDLLKKGLNTVVLYSAGSEEFNIFIENSLYPNRSARSCDSGVTWDYEHIGRQGFCDGEYLVRLRLAHYPSEGVVRSDYIDIGDLMSNSGIRPVFTVSDILLDAVTETPGGTDIAFQLRGGSTPSYDPSTWDSWKPAKDYRNLKDTSHEWKFCQWSAVLSTGNARRTPSLNEVTLTIDADVAERDGLPRADLSGNQEIVRGYYNYAFQPFDDDRLQYLREYFRLDEVVGGCSTEFEKYEVLATWLRGQWRDGWNPVRIKGLKTPWDAWTALNLNSDFKASGMCTIYANTFVQCALSVGLTARGVLLDHHFISEIWSNEYKRWVMFDIGFNHHSLRTVHMTLDDVPLTSVDILQAVNNGRIGDLVLETPDLWHKRYPGDQAQEAQLTDPKNWRNRTGIPLRNNFMESWLPGELQHGFQSYSYDGYLWWKKTLIPEYEEYTMHTSHYRDLYWTVNQIEAFLYDTGKDGEVMVMLDTVTPNLKAIMLSIDGGEWTETPAQFRWPLKKGRNTIRVKPVNSWDLDGITSEITVTY